MLGIPERDPITGLPTLPLISRYFAQLASEQDQFGMLLLDIDGFIFFNDRYGHQEGDQKLKQLAHLIGQIVPNGASVFRSGGDEFVIFLIGRQMAEVVSVAIYVWNTINQQFLSLPALEKSYCFPDKSRLKIEAPLAISCGVAFYPAHGISFASLCEAANNAMYQGGKCLHRRGVLVVAEFKR